MHKVDWDPRRVPIHDLRAAVRNRSQADPDPGSERWEGEALGSRAVAPGDADLTRDTDSMRQSFYQKNHHKCSLFQLIYAYKCSLFR